MVLVALYETRESVCTVIQHGDRMSRLIQSTLFLYTADIQHGYGKHGISGNIGLQNAANDQAESSIESCIIRLSRM